MSYQYHPNKEAYMQFVRSTLQYLEPAAELVICEELLPKAQQVCAQFFAKTKDKYVSANGQARFHAYHFDQQAMLMIVLASEVYKAGHGLLAEKIYFHNKSKYQIDWFPAIPIPTLLGFNHAFGAIIGKFSATEGSSLYFCQTCTIGSNVWFGNAVPEFSVTTDGYCSIDGHLTMLPTSQLVGSSISGRVILANGACVINEHLEDLTICFGRSPFLQKKKLSETKWESLWAFRRES